MRLSPAPPVNRQDQPQVVSDVTEGSPHDDQQFFDDHTLLLISGLLPESTPPSPLTFDDLESPLGPVLSTRSSREPVVAAQPPLVTPIQTPVEHAEPDSYERLLKPLTGSFSEATSTDLTRMIETSIPNTCSDMEWTTSDATLQPASGFMDDELDTETLDSNVLQAASGFISDPPTPHLHPASALLDSSYPQQDHPALAACVTPVAGGLSMSNAEPMDTSSDAQPQPAFGKAVPQPPSRKLDAAPESHMHGINDPDLDSYIRPATGFAPDEDEAEPSDGHTVLQPVIGFLPDADPPPPEDSGMVRDTRTHHIVRIIFMLYLHNDGDLNPSTCFYQTSGAPTIQAAENVESQGSPRGGRSSSDVKSQAPRAPEGTRPLRDVVFDLDQPAAYRQACMEDLNEPNEPRGFRDFVSRSDASISM
ncbi:unnamed protein product [Peniophora sp. CBMAI 1063]|nr:unnamed protein product [Peniophora sp. CBMAI 1063]